MSSIGVVSARNFEDVLRTRAAPDYPDEVAVGVGHPRRAQVSEEVVWLIDRTSALRRDERKPLIHIVGPDDGLSAWRSIADVRAVNATRRFDLRDAQDEAAQAHLDMDWLAFARRTEDLGKPKQVSIEPQRGFDVGHVEVDLRVAKHGSTNRSLVLQRR
jgi:hypothetical protein